jgi:hypothetical protein
VKLRVDPPVVLAHPPQTLTDRVAAPHCWT